MEEWAGFLRHHSSFSSWFNVSSPYDSSTPQNFWTKGSEITAIFRDYDALSAHDIRSNCKTAFDAGEILGIHKIIEPADMDLLMVPDKLSVVTYLHQLRAHFTGTFES